MATIRHEFYESDQVLTLSVFEKNADPEQVKVTFLPRRLEYKHGDKELVLDPLKGQIDPEKSSFVVRSVKVEIKLVKMAHGRWGALTGESADVLSSFPAPSTATVAPRKSHKNWDGITTAILEQDKGKTPSEDPNAGGDAAVNDFFQKLYADADEDTRRAMLKSYQESGGTTLSTNWDEVGKAPVEVKPPEGSEWKKWAV